MNITPASCNQCPQCDASIAPQNYHAETLRKGGLSVGKRISINCDHCGGFDVTFAKSPSGDYLFESLTRSTYQPGQAYQLPPAAGGVSTSPVNSRFTPIADRPMPQLSM